VLTGATDNEMISHCAQFSGSRVRVLRLMMTDLQLRTGRDASPIGTRHGIRDH
jgi:hypothetical protein